MTGCMWNVSDGEESVVTAVSLPRAARRVNLHYVKCRQTVSRIGLDRD
jgi:hypothetical protein